MSLDRNIQWSAFVASHSRAILCPALSRRDELPFGGCCFWTLKNYRIVQDKDIKDKEDQRGRW
jgi:hypothetical protein